MGIEETAAVGADGERAVAPQGAERNVDRPLTHDLVGGDDALVFEEAGQLTALVHRLADDAAKEHFDIGVIAVPADGAQFVADTMVAAGIKAIMNFAPAQISVPADVVTRTVNMGLEFEALSFALANLSK